MQDVTVVRTAAELEKKYGLYKLVGLTKNIETNNDTLIKLENELNNTINSLIINLGDVLDNQSDISLWFYQGIPRTNNLPYTAWTNKEEHDGDIYYDQDSGYVYQFKYSSNAWIRNEDENLIQAMAITNSDIDTTDHERKVFIKQPTVPYQSGDWWILEDGTLKICQIGKTSGQYVPDDFIVGNKYTPTIATQDGDIITIKQGQIIKMSDNFASFTDLATGGSTTIAGENISTGSIKSNNYVKNVSGTSINLSDGTIDSKNFKVDNVGNLNIGGYLTSANGILTNFIYRANSNTGTNFGNYNLLGFNMDPYAYPISFLYSDLELDVNIPSNFVITSANLTIYHTVVDWYDSEGTQQKGYSRNIRVYKAAAGVNTSFGIDNYMSYKFTPIAASNLTQIANIGTPTNKTTLGRIETMASVDIKNNLSSGLNKIIVRSGDSLPTGSTSTVACQKTGLASAVLNVVGYMKIS